MSSKLSSSKFFVFLSFIFALVGLAFFASYKIPFLANYLSLDANKNLTLLLITSISSIFYIIYLILNKEVLLPENKLVRYTFLAFPVLILISTALSINFSNSFFGKYIYLQSAVSFISIVFLTFVVASYFKASKRLAWLLFVISNLFVTIPVMLGMILMKFNLPNLANKLVYFIENWDVVAAISGIIIIIGLVYFETIARNKKQKTIFGIIIALHLILLSMIVIPDIWYALSLTSLVLLLVTNIKRKSSDGEELKKTTPIYKKYSFYVFLISIIFSVLFSINSSFTNKVSSKIMEFSNKYSGVNYNFVKPKLNISLNLGLSELKKGKIFGAGPNEFYKVWQQDKPQSVVESNFWSTDFVSSYSALTTLFVTIGIVGTLMILGLIFLVFKNIWRKVKKSSGSSGYLDLDEENRFYFLTSAILFIYASCLVLFFANVLLSIVLFAISIGFISTYITKWREHNAPKVLIFIMFALIIIILAGTVISINRVRAASISSKAISSYQTDGDLVKLESSLVKAANTSNDDSNYRLLSQFYLFKTQQILNTAASNTQVLQEEVVSAMNSAMNAANTAIKIDPKDYNNYMTLGSAHGFLMSFDQQNKETDYQNAKEAYNKALALYPKNPSILLSIAELEYAYNQNIDNTASQLQKSLQIKPNYSSAYYLFSQLAVQSNNRDAALQYASQAIQSDSQNVQAYLQYGILTLNKKDLTQEELNQAYTAFVSVLNLDPNNLTAAYYLSITYILAKEYALADNLIKALEQVLPNDQRISDLREFLMTSSGGNFTSSSQNTATSTATSTAR